MHEALGQILSPETNIFSYYETQQKTKLFFTMENIVNTKKCIFTISDVSSDFPESVLILLFYINK